MPEQQHANKLKEIPQEITKVQQKVEGNSSNIEKPQQEAVDNSQSSNSNEATDEQEIVQRQVEEDQQQKAVEQVVPRADSLIRYEEVLESTPEDAAEEQQDSN